MRTTARDSGVLSQLPPGLQVRAGGGEDSASEGGVRELESGPVSSAADGPGAGAGAGRSEFIKLDLLWREGRAVIKLEMPGAAACGFSWARAGRLEILTSSGGELGCARRRRALLEVRVTEAIAV